MLPIARVFGLSLQTPLLALLMGVVLAIELARRIAPQRGLDGNILSGILANSLFAFILGARLGYVITSLPSYLKNPLGALALNTTALLPWAGWLVAIAFSAWSLRRKQLLIAALLDVLAPAACVFGMGLALSDLLSGNNFGTPTTLPWAINLWGALRHPVQMYEFIALGVVLMALVWADRRNLPTGALVLLGIGLAAFARVLVDGFRAEVPLVLGLRITQLAGVFIAVIALWLWGEVLQTLTKPIESAQEAQQS